MSVVAAHRSWWMLTAILAVWRQRSYVVSYPTGAGACPKGRPAVGGPHLASNETIINGTLADGGLTVSVGGTSLGFGQSINIDVGYTTELVLTGSSFRGFLFRIDAAPSTIASGFNGQPAAVCTSVGGVTHFDADDKQVATARLFFSNSQENIELDVTVVISIEPSEFYYSRYRINALFPGEIITSDVPSSTPTGSWTPTSSWRPSMSFQPSDFPSVSSAPTRSFTPTVSISPSGAQETTIPTKLPPLPKPTRSVTPTASRTSAPTPAKSTSLPTRRPQKLPTQKNTRSPTILVTRAPTSPPTMRTPTRAPKKGKAPKGSITFMPLQAQPSYIPIYTPSKTAAPNHISLKTTSPTHAGSVAGNAPHSSSSGEATNMPSPLSNATLRPSTISGLGSTSPSIGIPHGNSPVAPKAPKVMKKGVSDEMPIRPMKKLKKAVMSSNVFGHHNKKPTISPMGETTGSPSLQAIVTQPGAQSVLPSPSSLAIETSTNGAQTTPNPNMAISAVKGKKMKKGLIDDKKDRADKLVKGSMR